MSPDFGTWFAKLLTDVGFPAAMCVIVTLVLNRKLDRCIDLLFIIATSIGANQSIVDQVRNGKH